jgi:spoIIIJ-associated protein
LVRVSPLVAAPKTEVPAPVQESDAGKVTKEVLESLIGLMGVSGSIEQVQWPESESEDGTSAMAFDIEGEDLGILIGRRGQTLASLQYLVRLIVGRKTGEWLPVVIDVEGYKQRRSQALRKFAVEMADRVKARGAPFTLEPMPPFERRIIHMALADNANVYTESVGQGDERKVVIRPKK